LLEPEELLSAEPPPDGRATPDPELLLEEEPPRLTALPLLAPSGGGVRDGGGVRWGGGGGV